MKLNLPDVTNANSVSIINSNFAAIEQELQNKVLYRDNPNGEPNTLETALDANGKEIYNAGTLRTTNLYIDGERVIPSGVVVVEGDTDISGLLVKTANLSDVQSTATSRINLGLGNVDNTSDINKPISSNTASALAGKQATLVSGVNIKTINSNSIVGSGDLVLTGVGETNTTSNLGSGQGLAAPKSGANLPFKSLVAGTNVTMSSTANDVTINATVDTSTLLVKSNNLSDVQSVTSSRVNLGLGNVDNTSDANKPISVATASALATKQPTLVSASNIKTINGSSILGSGDLVVSGASNFVQAGTGAVTRTMQNKGREIFSVKDFGAVGDGVANDTAAFQAALNAISAGGDDCVLEIPSGTYSLEGNLVYNSANRLTVRGMGMPRLHFKDASLADHWSITSSQSFRMRDLEIQFTPPASNGVRVGLKINAGGDHSHVLSNIRIGILITNPARTIVAFDIINPSLSSFTDVYVRADHGGASSGPVAGQNLIAFTCTATNKISTDSIFQSCTVIGFEIAWTVFPPILNPVGLALEGIAWRDCTVVGCVGGVYIQGDSSNAYKSPFWRWYGGHISTTKYIFKCIWVAQILITNGYFYVTYTSGVTDARACFIDRCQDVKIENNFMYLLSAPVGFAFTGFYAGSGSQRVNTIDNSLVGANATTTLVSSGAGSSYSYAKGNRKVVTVGGSPGITVSFGGTYDMDMGDNVSIVDGSAPAVPPQGGLLLAGGYSRALVQVGGDLSSASPTITFPIPFKAGTSPAVFFTIYGTANTTMEMPAVSSISNTSFQVMKKQLSGGSIILTNYQILWYAVGEPA